LLVLIGGGWLPDNPLFFSELLKIACYKLPSAVRPVAAVFSVDGFVPAKKVSKGLNYFIFNRDSGDFRYLDIII
jgi:hypothetical protein